MAIINLPSVTYNRPARDWLYQQSATECNGALGSTSLTAELLAIHRFCQRRFTLVYALLNWAGCNRAPNPWSNQWRWVPSSVGQKGKWIYANPRERLVKSGWTGVLGTRKEMEMDSCLACMKLRTNIIFKNCQHERRSDMASCHKLMYGN